MAGPRKISERSIALFLLGALAFSPPFLLIFSSGSTFFGIPSLYAYLFAAWMVLILLARRLAERARTGTRDRQADEVRRGRG